MVLPISVATAAVGVRPALKSSWSYREVVPLVTKRYIYAAYKKKNLDDLFLKVRQ